MDSLKNVLLTSLPFRPRRPDPAKSDSKDEDHHEQNTTSSEEHEFFPSVWDVLKVRYLLQWKTTEASLPTELVDEIIDAAEYWPSTMHHMRRSPNEKRGRARIGQDCDGVLFKTVPLCYDKEVSSYTQGCLYLKLTLYKYSNFRRPHRPNHFLIATLIHAVKSSSNFLRMIKGAGHRVQICISTSHGLGSTPKSSARRTPATYS